VTVMHQPIDHSGGHVLVVEDRHPPGELQVGRQYDASSFIAVGDNLKQEPRPITVDRYIATLIEYKQVNFR
jgi:hypothetical protein